VEAMSRYSSIAEPQMLLDKKKKKKKQMLLEEMKLIADRD